MYEELDNFLKLLDAFYCVCVCFRHFLITISVTVVGLRFTICGSCKPPNCSCHGIIWRLPVATANKIHILGLSTCCLRKNQYLLFNKYVHNLFSRSSAAKRISLDAVSSYYTKPITIKLIVLIFNDLNT